MGFSIPLFYVSSCFVGEFVKGVLGLLTLGQGRSDHVQKKGLSWTLGQCRVSSYVEKREKNKVLWALACQCKTYILEEKGEYKLEVYVIFGNLGRVIIVIHLILLLGKIHLLSSLGSL